MTDLKSENPAYPDAHPTAPGGMSQKALRKELVETSNWTKAAIQDMNWPELIERVVETRRANELALAEMDAEIEDAEIEHVEQPMFLGMPDTKDFIFDGHAGAGPSGAERWMNCTASLGAARAFLETLSPNQQVEFARGSDAARQGTTAHAAAEVEARVMLGEMEQAVADATLLELTVMPPDGEAYDEEMASYITEYTDLVKQYHDAGRTVLIESRVEAVVPLMTVDADGDPDVHVISGSADMVVLPSDEEPVLVVGDLKYGNGLDVDVESNPQIRIYGLGVLSMLCDEDGNLPDLDHIEYHIIQPRLGGIKTWSESVEDLLTWRDEVLSPALTEALGGQRAGAKFTPSELACQWCPARGGCSALAESRLESATELFDTIVEAEFEDGPGAFPETSGLSDERLGSLLGQINGLIKIADDLKAEAQRRLHRGTKVPGFKLVSYTPARRWISEAAEVLAEDPRMWKTPTLVSPTQALKMLKDDIESIEEITPLIDAPPKRPIVAAEHDRRAEWEGLPPEVMFDILEGDD